jgi:pimeloyl-ACP methyl ester carboxylesterase
MTELTVVLLPGLDGSGVLFGPLVGQLPPELRPIVVAYPPDQALGYDELLPLVLQALPNSAPFIILGESFSGPLALMAAARSPKGLQAVILCASFVRNPILLRLPWLRHVIRGFFFRLVPEFVRTRALMGRYSTPDLRRLTARALATVSPRVLAHRVRSVLQTDVRQELRGCAVPVLYFLGTHDRMVSRRNVADVIADCPAVRVVELPAPHFGLQTQPGAAAAAIVEFITTSLQSNPLPQRTTRPGAGAES